MNKQQLLKYVQIFVCTHYLFQDVNSLPGAKLKENCEFCNACEKMFTNSLCGYQRPSRGVNPRATQGQPMGLAGDLQQRHAPHAGHQSAFAFLAKYPRAIPTGFARNLLSQRSAVFATGQASSLARCSSSPRGKSYHYHSNQI